MRQLPAGFVKKLWPPASRPARGSGSRTNVIKGVIPQGSICGSICPETPWPRPSGHADSQRSWSTCNLRLAVSRRATSALCRRSSTRRARVTLQGDRFELLLDKGSIQVPSGGYIGAVQRPIGNPCADRTASHLAPSAWKRPASANHVLELLDQDPLNYAAARRHGSEKMGGNARIVANFDIPFVKRQKPKVSMTAEAVVDDMSLSRHVRAG